RRLGVRGERNSKGVPVRAVVDRFLAWRQVVVAVRLVTGRTEAAALEHSLTHVASRRTCRQLCEHTLDLSHSPSGSQRTGERFDTTVSSASADRIPAGPTTRR